MSEQPVWQPSTVRIEASALHAFTREAARLAGQPLGDYASLHHWSTQHPEQFWPLVAQSGGVR